MNAVPIHIFVDESIHDALDFIVSAFVFSKEGLDSPVSDALRDAGLRPGVDEFKSRALMLGNAVQQNLRETLLSLAGQHTRVALAVSPASLRAELGEWCLRVLQTIVRRNGFHEVSFDAHFDEGIFRSTTKLAVSEFAAPRQMSIDPKSNSRTCLGIQVADVVASAAGQMIREAVTGRRKMVGIGGPGTGYADDDEAPLGWSLKMSLRYSLLRRPIVHPDQPYHPDMDPVVVERGYDYVEVAQHPEVSGWGVHIHDALSPRVRAAVDQELGRIWLGCIH